MSDERARKLLTELILEVFRLNGRLLAAGDRLVGDLGLTSARWQVLGAVALAEAPMPVAWIARNMGLTRQAVQRIVNELIGEGALALAANPHHRRAKLVVLTDRGKRLYQAIEKRRLPWADALAEGLTPRTIASALATLRTLREGLEDSDDRGRRSDDR
jgi:DNA-binding MarR family transcriptional regulator